MRENVDTRLAAAQKRHKYDYDERVRNTLVFKESELVFVYRPSLAVNTNMSKTMDKTTYSKVRQSEHKPNRIKHSFQTNRNFSNCVKSKI